ncbi:secreted protein [Marinobacter adhaerens HP15]|uniref:Secreted protein n=1 Tax=Marinobacter adhaerens (strain DSM 23420 / HP15) TaxID=225937 RepID=E4PK06_MARAH|nr:secreted protein [Marinobacter adhaerens HP15]
MPLVITPFYAFARLLYLMAMPSMSAVPTMHKDVDQWAGKQYQPRQSAKQMNLVFSPE